MSDGHKNGFLGAAAPRNHGAAVDPAGESDDRGVAHRGGEGGFYGGVGGAAGDVGEVEEGFCDADCGEGEEDAEVGG